MQLTVERPPTSSQNSPPTSDCAVPHEIPSASQASLDVYSKHFKTIPKEIKFGSIPSTIQILTYTLRNDGKM
jgi:hypothetical protein